MAASKSKDQSIREAIDLLVSQGRDVTTAAVLAWLSAEGIKAKASDIHASPAWSELKAQEKKTEPKPAKALPTTTQQPATPKPSIVPEKPMAKAEPKKPNFPSKTCPKCGKLIHARSQKHEACGWVMDGKPAATSAPKSAKKLGRPKKVHAPAQPGGITIQDIEAVKALVDKIGAARVRDLAQVLVK